MTETGLIFGLPLLTKDLIEQSARRRTYILRVIYAAVLYGAGFGVYGDISGGGFKAGLSNLGRGGEMFDLLVQVQFIAIIVILPAISCGAITSEKERDTLGLLLLTQLSPTVIVLEKLLSRLVTMGTYQLLSLPLFAVVYGMGGVELSEIIGTIWYLILCSAVVASWSIYCSTWHRTTTGAFIASYAMMPLAICLFESCLTSVGPMMNGTGLPGPNAYPIYPNGLPFIAMVFVLLSMAVPMVGLTFLSVATAQAYLLPRAFVPPRNVLLELFKKLDAFFEELNKQTTKGIVLVREYDTGPMFEPIAWRETRKKSLGTVRYLFRLLVALEGPLVMAISWAIVDMSRQSFDGPTAFFQGLLWPVATLAVVIHTTSTLASERSRQTLDVLLVAPLTQQEIVSQKLAGVRRLIGVLSVPFITLLIFQSIWTLYVVRGLDMFHHGGTEGTVFLHEILGLLLATIVYLRVVQWIAFHLILRLKNQTQAVLLSVAAVICVCGLPLLVPALSPSLREVEWLSPVRILFHRQFVEGQSFRYQSRHVPYDFEDANFMRLTSHAIVYVALWLALRYSALNLFSRVIGRTEPTDTKGRIKSSGSTSLTEHSAAESIV